MAHRLRPQQLVLNAQHPRIQHRKRELLANSRFILRIRFVTHSGRHSTSTDQQQCRSFVTDVTKNSTEFKFLTAKLKNRELNI
jgi:hypothetical protein